MRRVMRLLVFAVLLLAVSPAFGQSIRVTTWNLEWFPNGSQKTASPEEQARRIGEAAAVLRQLSPDVLLLQEVEDYDICARLADEIRPRTYQVCVCSAFKEANG